MARDRAQHVPTARAQCSVALTGVNFDTCCLLRVAQQSMRFSDDRDNDHVFRTTNGSHGKPWRVIAVRVAEVRRNDATMPCQHEVQLGAGNIART